MTKIEMTKKALGFVAQIGAGKIFHSIVKNNVEIESTTDLVAVAVGSFALGGAVAEVAKDQIGQIVDEAAEAWRTIVRGQDN